MNEQTPRPQRLWLDGIIICLMVLLRFFIAGHDEFMPINSDPLNYARNAEFYLLPSDFSVLPQQMPGMSILAMFSTELGIPYKIFQDLLLIVVGIFAWRLVRRQTGSSACALIVFAVTVLNPWFMQNSRFLLSEPLASIFLLAVFVSAGYLIRRPTHVFPILGASIASAGMVIVRPEIHVLTAFWFFVAIGLFFLERKRHELASFKTKLGIASIVLIPVLVAFASTQLISQLHQQRYGVRTLTVTDASGIKDLMSALYSIVPKEEIRFAPVTLQSMTQACDECPTLDRYRERLLNTNTPACKSAESNLGLKDQFGTWLNWHLVNSFRGMNSKSNKEMGLAAEEIRKAQSEGRLPKRFGKFPISPLWRQWLPEIPGTYLTLLRTSFVPRLNDRIRAPHLSKRVLRNTVQLGFYDDGLLRRRGIGVQQVLRVHGDCPESGFRRARLFSKGNKVLAKTLVNRQANQYHFDFEVREFEDLEALFPLTVELHQNQDRTIADTTFEIFQCREHRRFKVKLGEERIEMWHTSTQIKKPGTRRNQLRALVIENFNLGLLIFGGFAFVAGCLRGIATHQLRPLLYLVLLGVGLLVLRCSFYVLVDVWLNWSGFRYVEPNNMITNPTAILFCFAIGASFNRKLAFLGTNRFSRHSNPMASDPMP